MYSHEVSVKLGALIWAEYFWPGAILSQFCTFHSSIAGFSFCRKPERRFYESIALQVLPYHRGLIRCYYRSGYCFTSLQKAQSGGIVVTPFGGNGLGRGKLVDLHSQST